jgi:hypothetical protein
LIASQPPRTPRCCRRTPKEPGVASQLSLPSSVPAWKLSSLRRRYRPTCLSDLR